MSMSRQHFQALADAIKETRHSLDCDPAYIDAIDAVAESIATACRRFNSGFKRDKFLEACGIRIGEQVQ